MKSKVKKVGELIKSGEVVQAVLTYKKHVWFTISLLTF